MILGTVTKQPAESFSRFIDFVRRLDTGETLTGVAVTARNVATGSDTTAMLVSSPAVSGTKGQARLSAGADAETHVIQVRVTTNLGNTYEDEFLLLVREE